MSKLSECSCLVQEKCNLMKAKSSRQAEASRRNDDANEARDNVRPLVQSRLGFSRKDLDRTLNPAKNRVSKPMPGEEESALQTCSPAMSKVAPPLRVYRRQCSKRFQYLLLLASFLWPEMSHLIKLLSGIRCHRRSSSLPIMVHDC